MFEAVERRFRLTNVAAERIHHVLTDVVHNLTILTYLVDDVVESPSTAWGGILGREAVKALRRHNSCEEQYVQVMKIAEDPSVVIPREKVAETTMEFTAGVNHTLRVLKQFPQMLQHIAESQFPRSPTVLTVLDAFKLFHELWYAQMLTTVEEQRSRYDTLQRIQAKEAQGMQMRKALERDLLVERQRRAKNVAEKDQLIGKLRAQIESINHRADVEKRHVGEAALVARDKDRSVHNMRREKYVRTLDLMSKEFGGFKITHKETETKARLRKTNSEEVHMSQMEKYDEVMFRLHEELESLSAIYKRESEQLADLIAFFERVEREREEQRKKDEIIQANLDRQHAAEADVRLAEDFFGLDGMLEGWLPENLEQILETNEPGAEVDEAGFTPLQRALMAKEWAVKPTNWKLSRDLFDLMDETIRLREFLDVATVRGRFEDKEKAFLQNYLYKTIISSKEREPYLIALNMSADEALNEAQKRLFGVLRPPRAMMDEWKALWQVLHRYQDDIDRIFKFYGYPGTQYGRVRGPYHVTQAEYLKLCRIGLVKDKALNSTVLKKIFVAVKAMMGPKNEFKKDLDLSEFVHILVRVAYWRIRDKNGLADRFTVLMEDHIIKFVLPSTEVQLTAELKAKEVKAIFKKHKKRLMDIFMRYVDATESGRPPSRSMIQKEKGKKSIALVGTRVFCQEFNLYSEAVNPELADSMFEKSFLDINKPDRKSEMRLSFAEFCDYLGRLANATVEVPDRPPFEKIVHVFFTHVLFPKDPNPPRR
eukprot:Rmarinus@m.4038